MNKHNVDDTQYFLNRDRLKEKLGHEDLWLLIDQWPLYVGIKNLGRFLTIANLLSSVRKVPGHVAEFGCWHGANLMFLAKILQITEPWSSRIVFGFDTFEGLETFDKHDGKEKNSYGKYNGDIRRLESFVELYKLQDAVELVVGDIKNTLPELLHSRPSLMFSFVFCDVDLHEPTRVILDNIHQRLSKGGVIVFDEWNDEEFPGETIAVREFMEKYSDDYTSFHLQQTKQPSMYLKKMR